MDYIETGWARACDEARRYNRSTAFMSQHVAMLVGDSVSPEKLNVSLKAPGELVHQPFECDGISTVEMEVGERTWRLLTGAALWDFHLGQLIAGARLAAEAGVLHGLAAMEAAADRVKEVGYVYYGEVGNEVRWNGELHRLTYRFDSEGITPCATAQGQAPGSDADAVHEVVPNLFYLRRLRPTLIATKKTLQLRIGDEVRILRSSTDP